ncbi:chemotaxis protein CheB [Halioxenophilus aromaticivorans]
MPTVIVIASEQGEVRRALTACVTGLGFGVLVAPNVTSSGWPGFTAELANCQLALVDLSLEADSDTTDHWLHSLGDMPTLYLDSPLPKAEDQRAHWLRRIALKVASMLAEVTIPGGVSNDQVWLLMGSAGGPEAVAEFISALPGQCPVGFLYGQHINPGFESHLVKTLNGRNGFNARAAKTGARLQRGDIVIAPSDQRLTILANDALLIEAHPWPGRYHPSLDGIAVEFNRRPRHLGGVIVFSGMGNDGAAAARLYASKGGTVWTQAPDSCVVNAMPEAVRASGCASYSATPSELAAKLAETVGRA